MTAVPRAVVVIVDPVRAGIKLAQLFNGLGHRCVAVLSEESDSEFWRASFRPQDFLFTLHEADGFDALVAGLRGHEVACLVPGGESGVDLADRLTPYFPGVPALDPERLGLNGPERLLGALDVGTADSVQPAERRAPADVRGHLSVFD
ncbi:hypothetical protein SXANM310S_02880 [Streptomyces xanthochromogenes]